MKIIRPFATIFCVSWILFSSPNTRATTITFDDDVTSFSGAGATFSTQGFQFSLGEDTTGLITLGGSSCSPGCPLNGTKYLLNRDIGLPTAVTLSETGGGVFSLTAFDAGESFDAPGFAAAQISVVGTRSDNSTVSALFSLDGVNDGAGSGVDFQTFALSGAFSNLLSVSFNGSGGSGSPQNQFALDNIGIYQGTPEPTTLLLLGVGLAGLGFCRRRVA